MKSDPTFWLLARASGLTAYVLLTASGLAGLVLKSRPFGRAVKAAAVLDLHRFVALLGLGAVALHGATLCSTRPCECRWPGSSSPARPPTARLAVALGVVPRS